MYFLLFLAVLRKKQSSPAIRFVDLSFHTSDTRLCFNVLAQSLIGFEVLAQSLIAFEVLAKFFIIFEG